MTTQYPPPFSSSPYPPRAPSASIFRALLFLLVAAAFGYLAARWWERGTPMAEPRPVMARGDLSEEEKTTIQLFKQASPSVVFITTMAARVDMRTRNVTEMPQGAGSGFIWDDAGDIVTNFHVVRGASGAKVTLWDHSAYDAELVGVAPDNDLAVVRIHAPKNKLRPIPIGQSSNLQVGQRSFAIGDPFGLDQSLTTGIISALGRTMQSVADTPIEDVIQTQAPINPGNSGGPLLDSAGRLIGVNTAILSPSGTSAGIGFAIPVDQVNRIVPQLVANGKVTRPRLGVQLSEPVSQAILQRLGIEGVLVVGIQPGSPADTAGLHGTQRLENGQIIPGDVIQKVDGRAVTNSNEFFAQLQRRQPGESVKLTIWREGQTRDMDVKLAAPGGGEE